MQQAEAPPLGIASIDRLRELSQASERRRATEGRQVLDVPVEEIHPDPDQVRRDFTGDVPQASDIEDLAGLAQSIRALGVRSPIRVRRDPRGGYVIVFGERRWRASRLAGRPTIPCLVDADEDFDPKRQTLGQLAENVQRSDLRLVDVVRAVVRCLEESGLSAGQLSKQLGKSPAWVSKHVSLSKARGLAEAALAEGHLTNLETARQFCRLEPAEQERLLKRARSAGAPISKGEVERLDRRRRAVEELARSGASVVARTEGAPQADSVPARDRASNGPETDDGSPAEGVHRLALTTDQLRELIRRLGGDAAGELSVEILISLLEE